MPAHRIHARTAYFGDSEHLFPLFGMFRNTQIEQAFQSWMKTLIQTTSTDIIAVDDKSNEITAIPKLLALLDIENRIITLDATGCKRKIAKQLVQS